MKHKIKTALRFGVSASIVLLAGGCTMKGGDIDEKDRNKLMVCKDFRDGEMFSFNTNTITNVRIGVGAPSAFDVTTTDGKKKTLSSTMEAWLKCENKQLTPPA